MDFQDILYEIRNGVAWITINRPEKMNAFRGTTCDELIKALNKAGYDKAVGCIVLAGAGDRAFCTGGDQSAHDGNYDGRGTIGLPMEELHTAIRDVPKPVIARVQGFAIGGGNVLCTICDLTTSRVLVPMEPVEPNTVMRFMQSSPSSEYQTLHLKRAWNRVKPDRDSTVWMPVLSSVPNSDSCVWFACFFKRPYPCGRRGGLLQGSFFMRLVSLWWELPPRLDSNSRIWNLGLQQKSESTFGTFYLDAHNSL